MTDPPIPPEYRGWWRIVDTGTWVNDGLDILGPALLSLTERVEPELAKGPPPPPGLSPASRAGAGSEGA